MEDRPQRVRQLLFLGGLVQAAPTLGFAQFDDFGRAALTMLLIVPATVSIITTSGFGHVYRAFAWPMLLSVAGAWFMLGWLNQSTAYALLGLAIVMYTSFLHGVARHARAVFMETCAYGFGEQQLNAELKLALAAAAEANRTKTQFLAAASHDLSLRPLDSTSRELVTLLGSVRQPAPGAAAAPARRCTCAGCAAHPLAAGPARGRVRRRPRAAAPPARRRAGCRAGRLTPAGGQPAVAFVAQ